MQKSLFLVSVRSADQASRRLLFWPLMTFAIASLAIVAFALRSLGSGGQPGNYRSGVLPSAVLFGLSLAFFAMVVRARQRISKSHQLGCPVCHHMFTEAELRVVGYKETCNACGARVFDEPPPPSTAGFAATVDDDAIRGKTRSEFLDALLRLDRGEGQRALIASIPLILTLTMIFILLPRIAAGHAMTLIWWSAMVLVALVAFLVLMRILSRHAARRLGVACPSCRHLFDRRELKYLGYSERCTYCNARIFA